jgi:hypothetical protein
VSRAAASDFTSFGVGFLSPDSTFEASVASFGDVCSFFAIESHSYLLDDDHGTCERRHGTNTTVADVRRGLTGGSARTLNPPRSARVLRCHYGGMVPPVCQTTVGGLLPVTIRDGADSKAQPVNLHVARTKCECAEAEKPSAHSIYTPGEVFARCVSYRASPSSALADLALTPDSNDYTHSFVMGVCMEQERQRLRSPNYPAFGLPAAIGRAEALFRKDGKAALHTTAAIKAWGYSTLNGRSLSNLGALRQYGLLEDVGPQMVKLSQLALTIILSPEDSPEYAQAIQTAARKPGIFAELFEQYPEGFPSDETMARNLTLSTNYSQAAANRVISAFRETINLADKVAGIDTSPKGDKGSGERTIGEMFPNIFDNLLRPPPGQTPKYKGGTMQQIQPPGGTPPYDLSLALLGGEQAFLRIPRHMTQENYNLLTSLINANLTAMKAALVTDAASVAEPAKPASNEGES